MAQGDPPVYQLVDSNGNVQAEIRHDLAQSLIIDQLNGSDIDFQQSDLSNIASASIEQIGSERHYAGAYDGADADERLDAAIAGSSESDIIYLESADYNDARTISSRRIFKGTNPRAGGSNINDSWDLADGFTELHDANFDSLTITGDECRVTGCRTSTSGSVTVSANEFFYIENRGGVITFEAGTEFGIVDSCTLTQVTDNGSNTVGDIA